MAETVLIADGDRASLELISAVLTRNGFEVLATPDGGDALARFFEASPAIVIAAHELPGLSGAELSRQIKSHSPATRVVLVHRESISETTASSICQSAGCDAVLPGPFEYPALRELFVSWGVLDARPAVQSPASTAPHAFGVPVPAPLQLGAPQAVAPPDPSALGAPVVAMPQSEGGGLQVPPLPTPIPLPIVSQTPVIDDDLPELDLDGLTPDPEPAASPEVPIEPAREPAPAPAPARVAGQLDVPLEGDLARVPFPRLLYELYLATFTGVLHVMRSPVTRSIYLRAGIPVRVDSHQMSEMLGRILIEHGRITMDDYAQSLQVMQDTGCRQGEALVQVGALKQTELLEALRDQTELKLANTFSCRAGTYTIQSDTEFEAETILCEVHPIKAIWRGVHEHYDLESLMEFFASKSGSYIVATDLFSVHYDTFASFIRDLDLMRLLDGRTTFEAALAPSERQARTAQALYVLLVTDMVQASEKPGTAVCEPSLPAPAPAAASPAPVDAEELERITDEIAREYIRLKESDYFDALLLDPSSSAEEVEAAYTNLMRSWRLDSLPPGLPEGIARRASELRDILNKARAVLSDPQARERYMRTQQQQYVRANHHQAPDAGPAMPISDDATLKLDVDASRHASLQAQRAYVAGQGLMERQEYKEAGRMFREAIEKHDREPAYRVALGKAILLAEGCKKETALYKAATCIQQALQLDPGHVEANLEMAKLLAASGKRDRAYSYVQRVLQRSPDHPEARTLLAALG